MFPPVLVFFAGINLPNKIVGEELRRILRRADKRPQHGVRKGERRRRRHIPSTTDTGMGRHGAAGQSVVRPR